MARRHAVVSHPRGNGVHTEGRQQNKTVYNSAEQQQSYIIYKTTRACCMHPENVREKEREYYYIIIAARKIIIIQSSDKRERERGTLTHETICTSAVCAHAYAHSRHRRRGSPRHRWSLYYTLTSPSAHAFGVYRATRCAAHRSTWFSRARRSGNPA